jgi:purine-binding chemotaxis protein CheW
MAIHSPLRYRRLNAHQTEATQQLLAFRLRQEWFALPIDDVQKVVQMGKVYGDPQGTGISLTKYQDRELLVIDVSQRIFAEAPSANTNLNEVTQVRFLAIVQGDTGELVGLPIDSPPSDPPRTQVCF